MGMVIKDKEIDQRIEILKRQITNTFGIKEVSKTDVLRFLLNIKKQGKKTHLKWKTIKF